MAEFVGKVITFVAITTIATTAAYYLFWAWAITKGISGIQELLRELLKKR